MELNRYSKTIDTIFRDLLYLLRLFLLVSNWHDTNGSPVNPALHVHIGL